MNNRRLAPTSFAAILLTVLLGSAEAVAQTDGLVSARLFQPPLNRSQGVAQGGDISSIRQQFEAAVRTFGSPRHEESAAEFSRIIDILSPQLDSRSDDLRSLLAQSYSYRAQVLLNTGRKQDAGEDIIQLLQISPGYEPGASVSAGFRSLVQTLKRELVGFIAVSADPADAEISIDGRPLKAAMPVAVFRGDHYVTLSRPGFQTHESSVTIIAGRTAPLTVALERPLATGAQLGELRLDLSPATASAWIDGQPLEPTRRQVDLSPGEHALRVQASGYQLYQKSVRIRAGELTTERIQLEQAPLPGTRLIDAIFPASPRRWLMVRAGGTYQTQMEPFTSTSAFVIYGRNAQVNATYGLDKKGAFDGFDFGATARVWSHLAVGASVAKVKFAQLADVQGTIPHPTSNFTRSVDGGISNLYREEKAVHVEIGATAGNDNFEATAFFGPSWLNTSQDVITRLTIREDASGPAITGSTGVKQESESRIGINLGADLAYLFARYAGVGVTFRYVRSDESFQSPAPVRQLIAAGTQITIGARFRY